MTRFVGLELFIATARSGSFSEAARREGLTPSAAAKSVSRLEERLGCKLFHRTTRRLSLTPEGEAYLRVCERVVGELDLAESELSPTDAALRGVVRMQLPGAFGRRHVLPEILTLAKQHPELHIAAAFTEQTLDIARAGYDLAVRIGHPGPDTSVISRRVGTQRLVLCAAPDYLDRFGAPKTIDDLRDRPCIAGPRNREHVVWLMRQEDDTTVPLRIQPAFELSDGDAMLEAGLAGCGIMQMPTWLVGDALRDGRLVRVLDAHAGAEMPIQIVWPATHSLQPRVRAVIDHLIAISRRPGSGFVPQI